MHASRVSIGDTTYNIIHASAEDQSELVSLINLPLHKAKLELGIADYNCKLLVWMISAIPNDLRKKIDSLVLHKTAIDGVKDKLVTINDFRGKIMQYHELLAKAILENVGDFFERLREENGKDLVSPK